MQYSVAIDSVSPATRCSEAVAAVVGGAAANPDPGYGPGAARSASQRFGGRRAKRNRPRTLALPGVDHDRLRGLVPVLRPVAHQFAGPQPGDANTRQRGLRGRRSRPLCPLDLDQRATLIRHRGPDAPDHAARRAEGFGRRARERLDPHRVRGVGPSSPRCREKSAWRWWVHVGGGLHVDATSVCRQERVHVGGQGAARFSTAGSPETNDPGGTSLVTPVWPVARAPFPIVMWPFTPTSR